MCVSDNLDSMHNYDVIMDLEMIDLRARAGRGDRGIKCEPHTV